MTQVPFHSSSAQSAAMMTSPRALIDKAASTWRQLLNDVFKPYRPELHYMRGPGPKWRAKHQGRTGTAS